MKIPPGFLDSNGKAAKGDFVLTTGDDQVQAKEFGTATEGNKTSCYVLTSPGDVLMLSFALRADIANHADFVVDGVLRNCRTAPTKVFNASFDKVVYQGRKSGTKRAAVRFSRMIVKERCTVEGMVSKDSATPSKVGSLEVHLYRAAPGSSTNGNGEALTPENTGRVPAFDKCAEWYDCNSNLNFVGSPPPFEIGFFDHTEVGKSRKDSLTKDLPRDYKLWGIFAFHLRSAEDLQQLGFDCAPESIPTPLPSATDPLVGTSGPEKGEGKLDLEATSTEKALAEDLMGNIPGKTPDSAHTPTQNTKATPRPTPNLTPPTTVSGLLNALSSANRDASPDARETIDEGSARGNSTQTTNRSNQIESLAHVPRYVSAQDMGASRSPEPVQATSIFQDSKEAVVLKQELLDHAQSAQELLARTPTTLRGVGGKGTSPGHQAFLIKGSTGESETRSPTPSQDDRVRVDGNGSFPARLPNQRAIDAMFSPGKSGFSQPRGLAEEKPVLSKSLKKHMSSVGSPHPNVQKNGLSIGKSAAFDRNSPHEGSQRPNSFSRAPSEASDTPTEVAEPEDIARAVRSSERSTQSTNTSHVSKHDHLGLGISNGPSFKTESIEYEQGNQTYTSPVLGSSMYPTPGSNIGSPLHQFFTARGHSVGSPGQPFREKWISQQFTPGSITSSSPNPQKTPKNFPHAQAHKQNDLRPTAPLKRKSDVMTGNSTPDAGSRKSSVAPGDRSPSVEIDMAAAEARISIAKRKRADLQQRLGAALELKFEKDKIRELNQRAADVERENAEMEAEIALIDEANNSQ